MKLVVYDNETENILRLCLKETDAGVKLIAVDKDGAWVQSLLSIDNKGRIIRYMLSDPFIEKYNLATEHDRLEIKD